MDYVCMSIHDFALYAGHRDLSPEVLHVLIRLLRFLHLYWKCRIFLKYFFLAGQWLFLWLVVDLYFPIFTLHFL